MIPYSFYVPEDMHKQLKLLAKERKAASMIRDALAMIFEGSDTYTSGYNRGIADAAKVVFDCEEAQMVAVKGKDIGVVLSERINSLVRHK